MDPVRTLILISLGVLGLLAALLGVVEWRRFRAQGARAHLYWSIGLFLVFFTLIEEVVFYAGYWTSALLGSYFFLVALLVGLLSFGSAEKTLEVIRRIQEDGTCWCGGTVWQGKTAMRISVSSWATTAADVEKSLAAMIRIARETAA